MQCRVVERRRCAEGGSMLRDKAAPGLGDVALRLELRRFGSRCPRYSQDTHYHFCCGRVLIFCHNNEAITTLSPLRGQAALRGEEWLLPPEGTAREAPHRAPVASSSPLSSSSGTSTSGATQPCHYRRSDRYLQAGKTHDSLLSVNTSGRTAPLLRRAAALEVRVVYTIFARRTP